MSALVRQYSPAPQLDESTEVHVPRFELRHLSEEGVRWLQAQQRDIPKGNPANVALDRALSQRLAGMQGGVPPAGAGHGEQDDGSSDGDDFEDDDDGDDDDATTTKASRQIYTNWMGRSENIGGAHSD